MIINYIYIIFIVLYFRINDIYRHIKKLKNLILFLKKIYTKVKVLNNKMIYL